MGQRHQIFLKVLNPITKNEKEFYNRLKTKEEQDEARRVFGLRKYTILAFHHQWLYGMSAAVNISNLLRLSDSTMSDDYGNILASPKLTYSIDTLDDIVNAINDFVKVQFNPLHPRGYGIERQWLLNRVEPYMRKNPFAGDNNDGITIIDSITRKYCMMNISRYESDYEGSVYSLPQYTPATAYDYMKAYYPDSGFDSEVEMDKINTKIRLIQGEIDTLSNGLLTIEEICKMFPSQRVTFEEFFGIVK